MYFVGVDVGGTNIKIGLIEDKSIIKSMKHPTNTFDIVRQISNCVKELVQSVGLKMQDVSGVAVGFPGLVTNSIVLDSANIGLVNCNLKEILEEELSVPVVVRNDGEMATIAEHKLGAGANCNNMILITLGTGVGGGIIINKEYYEGKGGAGELGHIIIERNGIKCNCGRKGCAEKYISMSALDVMAKDIMLNYPNATINLSPDGAIYATELVKAYKRNDACAMTIVDKYVRDLSDYIISLCNIFRPDKIVIGGGVTYAPEIIEMVAKTCRREGFGFANAPKTEILPATLGNQAGILGAVVCFEQDISNHASVESLDQLLDDVINEKLNDDKKQEDISLLDAVINSSKTEGNTDANGERNFGSRRSNLLDSLNDIKNISNDLNANIEDQQNEEAYIPEYDAGILDRVNAMLRKSRNK